MSSNGNKSVSLSSGVTVTKPCPAVRSSTESLKQVSKDGGNKSQIGNGQVQSGMDQYVTVINVSSSTTGNSNVTASGSRGERIVPGFKGVNQMNRAPIDGQSSLPGFLFLIANGMFTFSSSFLSLSLFTAYFFLSLFTAYFFLSLFTAYFFLSLFTAYFSLSFSVQTQTSFQTYLIVETFNLIVVSV